MTNASQKSHSIASAKWTKISAIGGSIAFMGIVVGCVPDSPSSEALNSSIVLTQHAPDANFSKFRTFFLRPEIIELTSSGPGMPIDPTYAQPLLDKTLKQMTARGFVAVEDKKDAELAVEMVYADSTWVASYCYSWWDPYYWGYPYWGYYPYYGGCTTSTWQTNTLATFITDLTPAQAPEIAKGAAGSAFAGTMNPQEPDGGTVDGGPPPGTRLLHGIWFSGIYGIIFSASDSMQKGLDGIDQAFYQSPYIVNY